MSDKPDGSMKWWHLENLGPYQAEDTEDERTFGGYGPFDTLEAAEADWADKTGYFAQSLHGNTRASGRRHNDER